MTPDLDPEEEEEELTIWKEKGKNPLLLPVSTMRMLEKKTKMAAESAQLANDIAWYHNIPPLKQQNKKFTPISVFENTKKSMHFFSKD